MKPIPEKVVNFNVYNEGTQKLIGIADEVTLPSLESMTDTISGAGIAGEFESPVPGHFGSITLELPFRTLFDNSFKLMTPGTKNLVLRAAQESYAVDSGQKKFRPLKITLRGQPKALDMGKVAVGKKTDTKNTIELTYLKVEENGPVLLELDKINFIYVVDGRDYLEEIRSMI